MRYLMLFVVVIGLCSCNQEKVQNIELNTLKEGTTSLAELVGPASVSAVIFLSPECPLSKNYAVTLRQLKDKFATGKKVAFVGVVSGTYFNSSEINEFRILHDFNFPIVQDPELKLANSLEATITPEVILLDSNFSVLYSGAIDNWAVSLVRQRRVITKHYLADAIEASLNDKPIKKTKTQAVGCFIQ